MICLDCGQDIERGLINHVNHWNSCKGGAPNESIESHRQHVQSEKRQWEEQERFAPIWKKKTESEKNQLTFINLAGHYSAVDNAILMGSTALERINKFKKEMEIKYLSCTK